MSTARTKRGISVSRRRIVIAAAGVVGGAVVLFYMLLLFSRGFGPGIEDFSAKLAGEYWLNRNSAHEIFISPEVWSSATPVIPSKVIECAVDGNLILVKRQGLRRRNSGPNDTYEEPAPGVFDYWILDTQTPKVFGPMSLAQFNAKRRELGVPDTVALKDVYRFRPFSIWR
jgi:hypothetical protein